MTRTLAAVTLAVLLAVLALVSPRGEEAAASSRGAAAPPMSAPDVEQARIRAHLERVEAVLRDADLSQLSGAQRAARAKQLEVLRAYRQAGVFPHNHVEPRRTPVFVDEHGTHCAVGHLLAMAGETELVERIAATRNTATVAELADEPGLLAWLERNGLTAEEAAQIQPWYGPIEQVAARHGGYATATVALTAVSAAASTWNLLADRTGERWYVPAAVGIMGGAASLGWGIHGLGLEDVDSDGMAVVRRTPSDVDVAINFAAGLAAAALGTRTLVLGRADARAARGVSEPARLELAPAAGMNGAGVRATLRF